MSRPTCPLTKTQAVDRYFLEHRAKLLDLAAFLDRCDRCQDHDASTADYRLSAMRQAIALLIDDKPDRARRILEQLSDHTAEPVEAAPPGAANGAPPRGNA